MKDINQLKQELEILETELKILDDNFYKQRDIVSDKISKLQDKINEITLEHLYNLSNGQYYISKDTNFGYHGDYYTLYYILEYKNKYNIKVKTWRLHRSDSEVFCIIEKNKICIQALKEYQYISDLEAESYIQKICNLEYEEE